LAAYIDFDFVFLTNAIMCFLLQLFSIYPLHSAFTEGQQCGGIATLSEEMMVLQARLAARRAKNVRLARGHVAALVRDRALKATHCLEGVT